METISCLFGEFDGQILRKQRYHEQVLHLIVVFDNSEWHFKTFHWILIISIIRAKSGFYKSYYVGIFEVFVALDKIEMCMRILENYNEIAIISMNRFAW